MNLLPILTCKIKARASDWAVEGKGGAKTFYKERGRERRRGRQGVRGRLKKRRWKGNGAEAGGLGKRQVIRDCIAGEQCSGKSAQSRCPAYIHIN